MLPYEIKEQIFSYLPFEKLIYFSSSMARKKYDPVYSILFAAKIGDLNIIKWICNNMSLSDCGYTYDDFTVVARSGCDGYLVPPTLCIHKKPTLKCYSRVMDIAAEFGHLEILKWLYKNKIGLITVDAMDQAAKNNHLDIIEWLYKNIKISEICSSEVCGRNPIPHDYTDNCYFKIYSYDTIYNAARNGHIEVLKFEFLHESLTKPVIGIAVKLAISNGHLEIVKFLFNNKFITSWSEDYLNNAARNGSLDIVKWLYNHFTISSNTNALIWAIRNNHIKVAEFLHAKRTEICKINLVDESSKCGNYKIVELLIENCKDCKSNLLLVDLEVNKTYNAMLRNLRETIHIEDHTTKYWKRHTNGREKTLLVETRIYIDIYSMDIYNIMRHALTHNQFVMVKWVFRHLIKSEHFAHIWDLVDTTGCYFGRLDIIKWLYKNTEYTCGIKAIDIAAENGHLDIVKWIHNNFDVTCTTDAMDNAAENGHLEVVKFLHENRTEGCTVKAMDYAAQNGHLEVVKFLHENRAEGCTTYAMDWLNKYDPYNIKEFLFKNTLHK